MFRNTQANPNDYNNQIVQIADNNWLRKIFCGNYNSKAVNPVYATFKGGLGSWNDDMTEWDYFCLWGHLRYCYNKQAPKDNWTWISLHGYKYGYTYSPVKSLLWNFNWHIAYKWGWPFIKIGFHKIWPIIK